ncbi:hypothetical protein [Streptomyces sp. BBFR102]|uniref:hypothetical protein n=1 Tax=Streptomyces sp. BBFR102 TaxID=3448171 RepID=UPI003F53223A
MTRLLSIELRRSAALGAALLIAVTGATVLHLTAGRWSAGWQALVMTEREYLGFLAPLAMAAGAWQSYREHRADIAELFASTPLPRPRRVIPILVVSGLAVVAAYLLVLLAAAPRIAGTAQYLPGTVFAVVAAGLVAMIASVWLGLAVGRLVPALATAPALAVTGFALLMFAPRTLPDGGVTAAFSPAMGMSLYSDYDTVAGGVSLAQALWMGAVAVAAFVLFAVRNRRLTPVALVPLVVGATATALIVPTGDAYERGRLDAVAQEQVCTADTPRVCVSRVHEGLLPAVASRARNALGLLPVKSVTEAHEDTTTFFPPTSPAPRADIALMEIEVGADGRLAHPDRLAPTMLTSLFAGPLSCGDTRNFSVATAVAHWLLDREPTTGPDGLELDDPEAVDLWNGLKALQPAEADARVAAVHQAAQQCQDTTGLLTGSTR